MSTSKEIFEKIVKGDISAIKDIKAEIYKDLDISYEMNEGTKSKEASAVLQLMDKDYSYKDALEKVLKDTGVDKKKLEKELDLYI